MFDNLKHSAGLSCALLVLLAGSAAAQQPGLLAREAAREYREQARYPEHSRALQARDRDPVRDKRTPTKQSRRGPEGQVPELTVWASAVSVEVWETIDLFAELSGHGQPVFPVEVTGEVSGPAGEIVTRFVYRDDGQGPDRRAGDGVWSSRLAMPPDLEPDLATPYMVRATARLLDGDLRQAAGGFLYSNPSGHLTGNYRDEVREGSLVISAEIDVLETGRFHLSGTLYAMNGEPVGTAQAAAELAPGRHWIDLSFYGLMFHERGAAGPYRLGTVALATTTAMPNALNDLIENAYITKPYRVDQMIAQPFGQPALLESAARLEAEAEGVRLQVRQ